MDTRNVLEEKMLALPRASQVVDLLHSVDDLDAISDNDNVHDVILNFTKKMTNAFNFSEQPLNYKQLQAIAYLTGYTDSSLPKPYHLDNAQHHFLNHTAPLKFIMFDRHLLLLQLLVRIFDPKLINQREEQVCGVSALMVGVAQEEPLNYVKFVLGLATEGRATLSVSEKRSGFMVKVESEFIFKQMPRRKTLLLGDGKRDPIAEADFIALVGLRHSQNKFFDYQVGGSAFGVTMIREIKQWMKKIGFEAIQDTSVNEVNSINRIGKLIADGYICVLLTTTHLVKRLQEGRLVPPAWGSHLLNGHAVQLVSIDYNKKDQIIAISLISWGEQIQGRIGYQEFLTLVGFGNVVSGITCGKWQALKRIAEHQSNESYVHPVTYYHQVRSAILSQEWGNFSEDYLEVGMPFSAKKKIPAILKPIIDLLNVAPYHLDGQGWGESAKKIQDIFYQLSESDQLNQFHPTLKNKLLAIVRCYLTPFIYPEEFVGQYKLKWEDRSALVRIANTFKDSYAIWRAIQLYLNEQKFDAADQLFQSLSPYLNKNESIKCLTLLDSYRLLAALRDCEAESGFTKVRKLLSVIALDTLTGEDIKLKAVICLIDEYSRLNCLANIKELYEMHPFICKYKNEIDEYIASIKAKKTDHHSLVWVSFSNKMAFSINADIHSKVKQLKIFIAEKVNQSAKAFNLPAGVVIHDRDLSFFSGNKMVADDVTLASQSFSHFQCTVRDCSALVQAVAQCRLSAEENMPSELQAKIEAVVQLGSYQEVEDACMADLSKVRASYGSQADFSLSKGLYVQILFAHHQQTLRVMMALIDAYQYSALTLLNRRLAAGEDKKLTTFFTLNADLMAEAGECHNIISELREIDKNVLGKCQALLLRSYQNWHQLVACSPLKDKDALLQSNLFDRAYQDLLQQRVVDISGLTDLLTQPFVLVVPPLLESKPGIFSYKSTVFSADTSSRATFSSGIVLN